MMINANKAPRSKMSVPKHKRKTRAELNEEGRKRKKLEKHRGHSSGSRNNVDNMGKNTTRVPCKVVDPRLGSKVPVSLLADSAPPDVLKPVVCCLSPEQELASLEEDMRLDGLLERLEQRETLNDEEQRYVDNTLDRINALMVQLGVSLTENDEEVSQEKEKEEDMLQLLRRDHSKDGS